MARPATGRQLGVSERALGRFRLSILGFTTSGSITVDVLGRRADGSEACRMRRSLTASATVVVEVEEADACEPFDGWLEVIADGGAILPQLWHTDDGGAPVAAGHALHTQASQLHNPCVDAACLNGGRCYVAATAGVCVCPTGLSGPLCETDGTDDCAPNPCLNGGTCIDGVDAYTCTCAAGYEGPSCATDIDDCASDPCLNGGHMHRRRGRLHLRLRRRLRG